MSHSLAELTGDEMSVYKTLMLVVSSGIHVSMPGIIQSFDAASQTAAVQPAIQDAIQQSGQTKYISLPVLYDVPVAFPRGGEYLVSLPVKTGDACILIFADSCIDGFMQTGAVSVQAEVRYHDLSDAIAIVGISTSSAPVTGYNPNNLEIRHKTKNIKISVGGDGINLQNETASMKLSDTGITLRADKVDINGTVF